ncbi:hypothetical protein M422DRAFT_32775 [Sphaerobolus stellatus SS14]|uniref:Enoyl reductase (ER) domain-containing protein n=1 Tax=Sphaerobolus stellatus (strain SS14) TaxID=990650 RepID=A0A0C9VMV1_SPHS4|nr:hypothetical protein M422DRAFT_32775 [Sphaerobolus stellatus SS14]
MSRIPITMHAVIIEEAGRVAVKEVPIPIIEPFEILVQVHAVAQNPTDWKHVYNIAHKQTIVGCDFSGVVVEVGASVEGPFEIGDRVAGFVQGSHWKDRGAFAEYVKTDWDLVWAVPSETTHEEAAAMSLALWTAVQGMYHPTRLNLVEPPEKVQTPEWIFIYGGSTSVGQYAIQLAKISGYKVVTVASPHNYELVKSLGADLVFDYHDKDAVKKIKEATEDSIHHALDTHAQGGSQMFTIATLAPGPGGMTCILPVDEAAQKYRPDINVIYTLLYTVLGREFSFRGKTFARSEEDKAHMVAFLPKLTELVRDGKIRSNKLKLWEGGLDAIGDGLAYMKAGKISGQKIVYKVIA